MMVVLAFVYVCENLVEVALTIFINLNNGRVYITQIFSRGPRQTRYNGVTVYYARFVYNWPNVKRNKYFIQNLSHHSMT